MLGLSRCQNAEALAASRIRLSKFESRSLLHPIAPIIQSLLSPCYESLYKCSMIGQRRNGALDIDLNIGQKLPKLFGAH